MTDPSKPTPPAPMIETAEFRDVIFHTLGAMRETSVPECYLPFAAIASGSGLPTERVRAVVRFLANLGYAAFARGLWTDDGQPRGAGYALTSKGFALLDRIEAMVERFAPSGSDLNEGVVERVAKAICPIIMYKFDGHCPDLPVIWEQQSEADQETMLEIARQALRSTPSSTLTPDAAIAHAFALQAEEDVAPQAATPAIRDQASDDQVNRDLRTQEYVDAAQAEIQRLQAELAKRADQAFEEAARVAETFLTKDWASYDPRTIADAIRALKGTPLTVDSGDE